VIAKKLKIEGPRLRRELRRLKIEGLDPKADFFKKEIAQTIIQALMPKKKSPVKTKEKKLARSLDEEKKNVLYLPESIIVKDLASLLNVPVTDLLKKILKEGITANLNQSLDFETASLIASDFGKTTELKEEIEETKEVEETATEARPPIVVVMGHVDHGKTTLLDYIRKTKVAQEESGGITQHIGAYQAEIKSEGKKRKITFIDTPGHEAFSKLRSLGAKVTDLVILVIAADDGVKPQTLEAIDHAKAAGIPIVVAINKIDKPGADAEKVKKELAEAGLLPEEWGGTTPCIEISAKKGKNIDELLELVLLTADLSDIRTRMAGLGEGVVIESHMEPGLGPLVSIICLKGEFKNGDLIVAGNAWGKIKRLEGEDLEPKIKLTPGEPARIIGFKKMPISGIKIEVLKDKNEALDLAEKWDKELRERSFSQSFFSVLKNQKILPLVVKADTQGSLDSIKTALEKLSKKEIKIKIVHGGVGQISESDIYLGLVSKALVLGFRVKDDLAAQKLAEQRKVKIEKFDVIYGLLQAVEKILAGLIEKEEKTKTIAQAEILKIFSSKIWGAKLLAGKVTKDLKFKIIRANVEIGEGQVNSLKIFAKIQEEIDKPGTEFGLGVKTKTVAKEGDKLEFFKE